MPGLKSFIARLIHGQTARAICCSLFLFAVLMAAYANSFHASWHYDDFVNIVNNPKVHATSLSRNDLGISLSAGLFNRTIGRPLAYLSFALNHRFGGLDVFGYHVVNFSIHWLTALFLFLFVRNLFQLPLLKTHYSEHADTIALIASLLWAVHPIQVTAVTYIVQRMASMAGLFYIMTMYGYLKGRLANSRMTQWLFFGFSLVAAFCALMTKENAIMVFYAVWLLDLMLVQGISRLTIRKNVIWWLCLTLVMALATFLYTDPTKLFSPFQARPFTQIERLMTQPRVLFLYLFLIVAPMSSRMSIVHDLAISRSLTEPWTTGPAIAGLLIVLIGLCLLARKQPLISFCGLFFFLNHIVEGSFLNLELIYEHRNYIPTMLLFVPIGLLLVRCLKIFRHRKMMQWMAASTLAILAAANIHTTFSYNKIFLSELSLWSHVVINYPELSLGYLNLGKVYWDAGRFEKANQEFISALEKDRYNNLEQKSSVLYNLGMYQALKLNNHPKAIALLEKARSIYQDIRIIKALAMSRLKTGAYQMAIDEADSVLDGHPDDAMALMIKAQGLRFLNRREDAAATLLPLLDKKGNSKKIALLALIEIYDEMEKVETVNQLIGEFLDCSGGDIDKAISILIERPELSSYMPNSKVLKQLFNTYIHHHRKRY